MFEIVTVGAFIVGFLIQTVYLFVAPLTEDEIPCVC